jgi:hypothetical protein
MSEAALSFHWSLDGFVRAYEAGAFDDHRVELIEGEIWPVVIGDWHGDAVGQLFSLLPRADVRLTNATLPTGNSLPDPDCWVRRGGAAPIGSKGPRLSVWAPADVLLVVEVSDETVIPDLNVKTRLYGSAGYPVYWVVTKERIFEHTDPYETGYRRRTEYGAGDRIPVGYAGVELAVDDLL